MKTIEEKFILLTRSIIIITIGNVCKNVKLDENNTQLNKYSCCVTYSNELGMHMQSTTCILHLIKLISSIRSTYVHSFEQKNNCILN